MCDDGWRLEYLELGQFLLYRFNPSKIKLIFKITLKLNAKSLQLIKVTIRMAILKYIGINVRFLLVYLGRFVVECVYNKMEKSVDRYDKLIAKRGGRVW